jgi:hypothetical protein
VVVEFGKFRRSLRIIRVVRELRMMDKRIKIINNNHAERVRRELIEFHQKIMRLSKNFLEIII